VSLSLYGSSFGLYLNPLFPMLTANQWGIFVIVLLFGANLLGLQLAAKVQFALVAILVSALAIYAGFAMPKIELSLLQPWLPEGIIGFVTAVFLLKFATSGAYMIVGLSGEMKNPRRVIPIVMTTATIVVAVLYAFVALASVGVVPWQEMINKPLTVAGEQFLPGWAMTYFLVGGAGLAICTTLNSQFIQLPRTFIVASWDQLIPESFGRLNRFGAPYVILGIMMAVGVIPLLVGLDIGDIARAATISASLPSIFVYWSLTRIHTRYPEQYANSMFNMKPVWIWALFVFSELSTFVGIYFLSRDLSSTVIWSLVIWSVVAVAYYPVRKRFLAKQGFDLDAATSDESIFQHD
jgi:APA family basic amino acid/polyamine antiporter